MKDVCWIDVEFFGRQDDIGVEEVGFVVCDEAVLVLVGALAGLSDGIGEESEFVAFGVVEDTCCAADGVRGLVSSEWGVC
jgi:hypothetical protein